jgi:hypothetical protein
MADKIKIGLIRCDTHGYYYGCMLDDCEPLALQANNYVCHHYFSNIYSASRLTMPRVEGFEIVKVWDENPASARRFSETFGWRPQVCDAFTDLASGVDAIFLADCNGSGNDHLRLAEPFLRRKVPIFVDKPFASRLADAEALVKLARQYGTPLFNASILSYVPAADFFKSRFAELAHAYWPVPGNRPAQPLGVGVVKGVGGAFAQELEGRPLADDVESRMAYLIHGVALALNLFGEDVEWVETMGTLPLEYLHLHLRSDREVMILNTSIDAFPESCTFYASAYGKYGEVHSLPIGDPEFLGGAEKIVRLFKGMLETGTPPVPYESFIWHIAVIEAAVQAQKNGGRVYLKDVLRDRNP